MKVVSYTICPFVQRVTALLAALRVPHEVVFISLRDKPDWFLEISPHGQVPILITEAGVALFESDAIDEVFGPLEPDLTPEARALNRAWSHLAVKNYLVQCGAQRSANADTLAERAAKLGVAFDRIERRLGDGPYFGGGAIGMVDIAWLTLLQRADIIAARSGYDVIGDRPKTQRWRRALMATDLPRHSVPLDFERAFAEYYLSGDTHLGRLAAERARTGSTGATITPDWP